MQQDSRSVSAGPGGRLTLSSRTALGCEKRACRKIKTSSASLPAATAPLSVACVGRVAPQRRCWVVRSKSEYQHPELETA